MAPAPIPNPRLRQIFLAAQARAAGRRETFAAWRARDHARQLARLAEAVAAYDKAEALSRFLNLRCGAQHEQVRYVELINCATPLGWTPRLDVTCIDWARQRLAEEAAR